MAEGGGEQVTPEQLIEQFRQMKVSDLLLSTLFTLSQLAYAKLDPSARDLEQARVAIDAMRALMPVVEPTIPGETVRDFHQVLANLQLAYASAASSLGVSGSEPHTPAEGAEPAPEAASAGANEASGSEPHTPAEGAEPAPEAASGGANEASGSEPLSQGGREEEPAGDG